MFKNAVFVPPPPKPEQTLANRTLETLAGNVSKALVDFSKWLTTGYAATLVLAIPKAAELATVVSVWHLKWGLALLGIATLLSVFVFFMGAQISASISTGEELRKAMPEILVPLAQSNTHIDFQAWQAEQERGLWWPFNRVMRWSQRRISTGDWCVAGRLVAKLSQAQAIIVFAQVLLGLAGGAILAAGLHLP